MAGKMFPGDFGFNNIMYLRTVSAILVIMQVVMERRGTQCRIPVDNTEGTDLVNCLGNLIYIQFFRINQKAFYSVGFLNAS